MEKHKIPTQLLRKPNSTINLLPAPQEVQISAQKVFFDNRAIPQVCQKRSPNHRLNYSFVCHQKPKSYSPAYSAVSSQHEEYYKSIESSLLSENRNLKEHTDFLSSQIRSMFQKQKRQCELLKSWKNKCKELETLNIELQQLLYRFTNQTLSTIKRIQKILTLQKFREEELLLSSLSKSQQLCTQTEETINNNLQELKTQISSILTVCSPKKVLITPPTKQAERDLESNKQSKNSKAYSSHFTDFNKIESKPKSKQQKEYSFYDGSPPKASFNQLI